MRRNEQQQGRREDPQRRPPGGDPIRVRGVERRREGGEEQVRDREGGERVEEDEVVERPRLPEPAEDEMRRDDRDDGDRRLERDPKGRAPIRRIAERERTDDDCSRRRRQGGCEGEMNWPQVLPPLHLPYQTAGDFSTPARKIFFFKEGGF
jgi:hypothetical protein